MSHRKENISLRAQAIELSKHGHHLLKNRQFGEASKVFEQALLLAPTDPYIMTGMGDALRQMKDFHSAAGFYRQVLEADPVNLFALRGLGDTLRGLKCYREAIENWKKYLDLKGSKDFFVLTRVADCYKALEDFENSQTFYHKALALNFKDNYSLMGLADLYNKHGMESRAVEYYEKALENGVALINILTIVGKLHTHLGNHEKARKYFEKVLLQEPDNAYALYGMGNYYRWKCDFRLALDYWERILNHNSGTVNLLARMGNAYCKLGQYDDAERAYRQNMDSAYDMFSAAGLINLYAIQGRLNDVIEIYDQLLLHEHIDHKVFSEVAESFIQRNEPGQAISFLKHVQQKQIERPEIKRVIIELIRQIEKFGFKTATHPE